MLASADRRARLTGAEDAHCRREVDALGQVLAYPPLDVSLLEHTTAASDAPVVAAAAAAAVQLSVASACAAASEALRPLTFRDVLAERGMEPAVLAALAELSEPAAAAAGGL